MSNITNSLNLALNGGKGSGNFGHEGRPGLVGGAGTGKGGGNKKTSDKAKAEAKTSTGVEDGKAAKMAYYKEELAKHKEDLKNAKTPAERAAADAEISLTELSIATQLEEAKFYEYVKDGDSVVRRRKDAADIDLESASRITQEKIQSEADYRVALRYKEVWSEIKGRVSVVRMGSLEDNEPIQFGVNWSAKGAQDTKVAGAFAMAMSIMVEECNKANELYAKVFQEKGGK